MHTSVNSRLPAKSVPIFNCRDLLVSKVSIDGGRGQGFVTLV